jgi:hypothetical protein
MPMDLAAILSSPPSGRVTAVVIDHQQYAQTVILRGRPIPWSDAADYSQFIGQAQGLLRPDTTLLDLGAFYAHALATDERLRSSLSARNRRGYALKTLLADGRTANAALELATAVAQTSAAPLVLQIPSPMLWLALTHELSGAGSAADLDSDSAENAAVYVAEWLRRLSELPVAVLLLDDRWTGAGHLPTVHDASYTPVSNVTEHYRWALARRWPERVHIIGSNVTGTVVPQDFWRAQAQGVAPSGDFLFAEIPADAVPETVLSRLGSLS